MWLHTEVYRSYLLAIREAAQGFEIHLVDFGGDYCRDDEVSDSLEAAISTGKEQIDENIESFLSGLKANVPKGERSKVLADMGLGLPALAEMGVAA